MSDDTQLPTTEVASPNAWAVGDRQTSPLTPVVSAESERPPDWSELAADPKFAASTPEKRLIVFDRWHNDMYSHASAQPDWNDESKAFNEQAANTQAELSKAAGGVTPDEARVKIAKSALEANKVFPNIHPSELNVNFEESQNPRQVARDTLSSLGPDVYKAYLNAHPLPPLDKQTLDEQLAPQVANADNEQISRTPGKLEAIGHELYAGFTEKPKAYLDSSITDYLPGIPTGHTAKAIGLAWDALKPIWGGHETTPAGSGATDHLLERGHESPIISDVLFANPETVAQKFGFDPRKLYFKDDPEDSVGESLAKGAVNAIHHLGIGLVSPLFMMSYLKGAAALKNTANAAFSVDMLRQVGPMIDAADNAKTPMEFTENLLGAAGSLGMGFKLGAHPFEKVQGPLSWDAITKNVKQMSDDVVQMGLSTPDIETTHPRVYSALFDQAKERGITMLTPEEYRVKAGLPDPQTEALAQAAEAAGAPQVAEATRTEAKKDDQAAATIVPPVEPAPALPILNHEGDYSINGKVITPEEAQRIIQSPPNVEVPANAAPTAEGPPVEGPALLKDGKIMSIDGRELKGNIDSSHQDLVDTVPKDHPQRDEVLGASIEDDNHGFHAAGEVLNRQQAAARAVANGQLPANFDIKKGVQSHELKSPGTYPKTEPLKLDEVTPPNKWKEPTLDLRGVAKLKAGDKVYYVTQRQGSREATVLDERWIKTLAPGSTTSSKIKLPVLSIDATGEKVKGDDGYIRHIAVEPVKYPVAEGVKLSAKPAPVDAAKLPTETVDGKVQPAWTNDPLTTIHQIDSGAVDTSANGKGQRLYIPESVMESDPSTLNPAIEFTAEKQPDGTYKDYVTGVNHEKYGVITDKGQYADAYNQDSKVAKNKAAQTKDNFKLTQESDSYKARLAEQPPLTDEQAAELLKFKNGMLDLNVNGRSPNDPESVAARLGRTAADRISHAAEAEAEYRLRKDGKLSAPASIISSIEATMAKHMEGAESLEELQARGQDPTKTMADEGIAHRDDETIPEGNALRAPNKADVAEAAGNFEQWKAIRPDPKNPDPIRQILQNLAAGKADGVLDKVQAAAFKRIAEEQLASGVPTDHVEVTPENAPNAKYAGLHEASGERVRLNLSVEHPVDFISTVLHEIGHVVTAAKMALRNRDMLNASDRVSVSAIEDINDAFQTEEYKTEHNGETPNPQQLAKWIVSDSARAPVEFAGRVYAADPKTMRLLDTMKPIETAGKATGKFTTLREQVVAWLKRLFIGKIVGKGTALEQAIEHVMNLARNNDYLEEPKTSGANLKNPKASPTDGPHITIARDPESKEIKHTLVIPPESTVENLTQMTATLAGDKVSNIPKTQREAMQKQINAELENRVTQPQASGIANTRVDKWREDHGMKPLMPELARVGADVWKGAMDRVDKEPGIGRKIVDDINNIKGPRKVLTEEETYILLHEGVIRETNFDQKSDELIKAVDAGDAATTAEARVRMASARDDIQQLHEAERRSGTEESHAFQARKMLMDQDYTRPRMETIVRTAQEGKPLTEKQVEDIKTAHDELEKGKDAAAVVKDAADVDQQLKDLEKLGKARTTDEAKKILKRLAKKAGGPLTNDQALARYKKALATRQAALEAKIAAGDFTKNVRNKTQLDEEAHKALIAYKRIRAEFDQGVAQLQAKNRPTAEKWAKTIVDYVKAIVISSPMALEKLMAAMVTRFILTPVEQGVGAIARQIPGLKEVAALAPREGGASLKAETLAFNRGMTMGWKDAMDILKTGMSDLDVEYSGRSATQARGKLLEYVGRLHYAIKAPAMRAEFERSRQLRTEHFAANGADVTEPLVQGMIALTDPILLDTINRSAYKEGGRAIFKSSSRGTDMFKAALGALKRANPETGKTPILSTALAALLETELPVVNVPMGIVAETSQFVFGSATGSLKFAMAMYKGVEKLKPDEADQIMRHLKKGSIGLAAMALAFYNPGGMVQGGGFYQRGEQRDEGDLEPESLKLFGLTIEKQFLHNPLYLAMQVAATARRAMDADKSFPAAMGAGMLGLTEGVPYMKAFQDFVKATDPNTAGKIWSEMLKNDTIPQAIQYAAKKMDKDAQGQDIQRKTDFSEGNWEGLKQTFESALPILRTRVAEKE